MITRPIALAVLSLVVACEARLELGAACTYDSQCPVPLTCRYGRCRAACLVSRDCPIGLRCVAAEGGNVCSLPQDELCTGDRGCSPPLTCPDGHCRLSCATDVECGVGATCGSGHCLEPISGESDAGSDAALASDAGSIDAPLGDGGWPASGHGSPCVAGTCAAGLACDTGDVCARAGVVPTCRVECGSEEFCPGVGVGIACRCYRCSSLCDPVLDAGCGSDVCALLLSGGSITITDCRAAGGTGVRGSPCAVDEDCAPEHMCFGGRGCVELCRSDADCRTESCMFDYIPPLAGETVPSIGGCGPPPG